jgi:hypothetical protein
MVLYFGQILCLKILVNLKYYHVKLQYILSLRLFVIGNKDNFITNLGQYNVYNRQYKDLYLCQANLAIQNEFIKLLQKYY